MTGTDSRNLSAIGDKNAWPGLVTKGKKSFFFILLFYWAVFLTGLAFVCLSQTFCCEGFELILLIVLPGRNLDLNLL